MTWHLENQKLEKQLIKSFPDFVQLLNDAMKKVESYDNEVTIQLKNKDRYFGGLFFPIDDVKEVGDYNPHDWNDFRNVMPPEDVWMRVEVLFENGNKSHLGMIFKDGKWLEDAGLIYTLSKNSVVRFRPWEES